MNVVPVYWSQSVIEQFVGQGLWGEHRQFYGCGCVGFADPVTGELIAGYVFFDWEPEYGVIEIAGYSSTRRGANKKNLKVIFEYPFEQLGARMVVARHRQSNQRVRRIWRALGAKEHLIPNWVAEGEALAWSTLRKEDWHQSKFMNEPDNG